MPLKSLEERLELIAARMRRTPLSPDVCLHDIAERTDGYSSAQLIDVCEVASELALCDCLQAYDGEAPAYAVSLGNLTTAIELIATFEGPRQHRRPQRMHKGASRV